jgi:hypothetical protein
LSISNLSTIKEIKSWDIPQNLLTFLPFWPILWMILIKNLCSLSLT